MTAAPALARHDAPQRFARVHIGLTEKKAGSVGDLAGQGKGDDREVLLIAARFRQIKKLAHEVKAGIRPDAADNAYGPPRVSFRVARSGALCCRVHSVKILAARGAVRQRRRRRG